MAAPYCRTQLRLLLLNLKLLSTQAVNRHLSLSRPKLQKKKSSTKAKDYDLNTSLSSVAAQGAKNAGGRKDRKSQTPLTAEDFGVPVSDDRLFKAPSFKEILHERHRQAQRTVIIRTQHPESTIQTLTSFGSLKHAHFTSSDKSYILAEFAKEDGVTKLQCNADFFAEPNQFPMRSRVFFDTSNRPHKKRTPVPEIEEGKWKERTSNIYPALGTIDQELIELCTCRSLDDSDLRSRFFLCLQIEELLQSVLPQCRVIPYGSCLNGFGWWNSDLDMMLCFNNDVFTGDIRSPGLYGRPSNMKILTEVFSSSRHLAQRTLTMVATLLELTPRVHNVYKILNARVPIIRFKSLAVNLHCDISVQQMDSIKMTELLYLYSVCDPRVKPLMVGIKQWAILHNLTSSGEQQKPTTIGILIMLIFYLQTRSPPVVPTLRKMQSLASTTEMFYIDNIVYGLPSNPSSIPRSQNSETTESLLHGFFAFYSEFDFKNKGISIIEGATFTKPADSTPIYIENPLCVGLNICRNVGSTQLKTFTDAMKEVALKNLMILPDGGSNMTSSSGDPSQRSRLSVLFSSEQSSEQPVKVQISELFADDSGENHDDENETVETNNQQEYAEVKNSSSTESKHELHSKT